MFSSSYLSFEHLLISGIHLAVFAFGGFGLGRFAGNLGIDFEYLLLFVLNFLLYIVDFFNVNIPFLRYFIFRILQFSSNLKKTHLSFFPLDDLVLAMLDINFQFLNLVVKAGVQTILLILKSEYMCL